MKPKDRFAKKAFRKTAKQTKRITVNRKPSKRSCSACGNQMHGVPSGKGIAATRKLSKTQKRPSAMFAGLLCNNCRAKVIDEALKIKYAGKKIEESSIKMRKFVTEATARIE
jgi:ribosomal protein L34E